jgi:hypothetical protein
LKKKNWVYFMLNFHFFIFLGRKKEVHFQYCQRNIKLTVG